MLQLARLDGDLADLFSDLDSFLRVVEINHAFVVACAVGKEAAITRKESGNCVEVREIAPRFLDGDNIEPAQDFGD